MYQRRYVKTAFTKHTYFFFSDRKRSLQRKQDSPLWQIFLGVSLCMFNDFRCHSWESRQYPGHASRKLAREKHELYLSCILIGQQENKSSYVTEIVLPLGFADVIFRRERSDDRNCVWPALRRLQEILLEVKLVMAACRCYDNSNVTAILIMTNCHLYLIQLWLQFF